MKNPKLCNAKMEMVNFSFVIFDSYFRERFVLHQNHVTGSNSIPRFLLRAYGTQVSQVLCWVFTL